MTMSERESIHPVPKISSMETTENMHHLFSSFTFTHFTARRHGVTFHTWDFYFGNIFYASTASVFTSANPKIVFVLTITNFFSNLADDRVRSFVAFLF
jgi:hypothetical protein